MDEAACYIDMSRDCTLHFRGAKNVEGADTGYRKQRYTVCLFVSLERKMLLPFLIFRGRKRAPKISSVYSQVIVSSSISGSMDTKLAFEWLTKVYRR
jgi:hypothetical protein